MHFLKFADQAEAESVLADYRNEEGWITASHTHALDVIGTIYKPTGTMLTDAEGNEYPETAPIPGFHVNMVGEIPAEIEAYCLTPDNPVRVFAS